MKVLNVHKRIINQSKRNVAELLQTLSTDNDKIWPTEKWPKMKFKNGIRVGENGGHGPIKYSVEKYNPDEIIQFRFSKPVGFNGIHKFEIKALIKNQTQITHTIDMTTEGKGTLMWILGIRSLHNALIEDGFDKLENNFSDQHKNTEWSFYVKFLRKQIAKRGKYAKPNE